MVPHLSVAWVCPWPSTCRSSETGKSGMSPPPASDQDALHLSAAAQVQPLKATVCKGV